MCEPSSPPFWQGREFSYFRHENCEYFPCHPTERPEQFNCLFCYCPLYVLGDQCGGDFSYLDNGYKDCSRCLLPHERENYGRIIERFPDVARMTRRCRSQSLGRTGTESEGERGEK